MSVKRLVLITIILIAGWLSRPSEAWAKRTVPQAKAATASGPVASTTKGVAVSVKFRSDRKAIVATFTSLSKASRVDYTLSYNTRGTTQGATGSIVPPVGEPAVREIIFGTCSHGVCRYDSGITNGQFTVTTYLTSGKKVIKNFKLKV